MAQERLLQLAQEIERLGAEESYYYQQPAEMFLPQFLTKQQELLFTADKMLRELAQEIRYNPARLIDVEYPLAEEIETISGLMEGLEEIKDSAVHSVDELREKTESLSKTLGRRFVPVSRA